MYEVRLVCEGPTDADVLRAVLDAVLDIEYTLTVLQPDMSLYGGDVGPHGGGWRGVESWCREVDAAGGLEAIGALTPDTDLLIIHVDADIAPDVGATCKCPPPCEQIQAVAAVVLDWLGERRIGPNVLLWIPSMATEAWLLRAFFPALPESKTCMGENPPVDCVECVPDPSELLLHKKPKFVRRKEGRIKKIRTEYRKQRTALT